MIVYGWKSKLLKQASLETVACENCKEKKSFLLIHANYAHIFWIPLFPYAKKAIVICGNCQHVHHEKNMPAEHRSNINALKGAVTFPKYLFSGLVILSFFALYLFYNGKMKDQNEIEYLDAPKVGDVYILKDEEESSPYQYYLFKLTSLEKDSLYFSPNTFQYNQPPSKLDPKDGFYNLSIGKTKAEILEMYQKGILKSVIRDYDSNSGFNKVLDLNLNELANEYVEN